VKLKLARACRRDRPLCLQISLPPNSVHWYDPDSRDALTGLNFHSGIEQRGILQNVLIIDRRVQMAQQDSNSSPAEPKPEQASNLPSCNMLFSQLKELLDTAEAKSIGYDNLQLSLQNEKRSVEQLRRALETQQRQIDSFVTQDVLVSQLTSQLAAQSKAIEQMEAKVQQQEQQYYSAQTQATASQQELGHKRKRIQELEHEGSNKQHKIQQLGEQLADYKDICSYVMIHTQVRMVLSSHSAASLVTWVLKLHAMKGLHCRSFIAIGSDSVVPEATCSCHTTSVSKLSMNTIPNSPCHECCCFFSCSAHITPSFCGGPAAATFNPVLFLPKHCFLMQRLQNQHRSHNIQASQQQHLQQLAEEAEAEADSAVPTGGISQVVSSGAEGAVPDNSLAEGAAGLLAMTSTADKTDLQVGSLFGAINPLARPPPFACAAAPCQVAVVADVHLKQTENDVTS